MSIAPFPRLLGDIGGTHARFAWQATAGTPLTDTRVLRCAEHPTLDAAVRHYLHGLQGAARPAPRACAIGIANPVTGDQIRMTNHHWSFSIRELQAQLGLERLLLINDFEALALALLTIADADLRQIGGGTADASSTRAVLGPGTGLGVAGLLPGGLHAVTGEGGHVTLAPTDDRESAVIGWLRRRFGHVSAERVLSGPGLVNLYHAISALDETPAEPLAPADIVDRALAGGDAACRTAVELFCAFLGSVAGNLALTLGARGGVYIGGGIVPRLGEAFERSPFRGRFEGKGRFAEYLAGIPTWVIHAAEPPALNGAARALDSAR